MAYVRRINEFRVNTQTAAAQDQPAIAALDKANFVVVWQDQSGTLGDADGASIKGQLYTYSGRVGSEFLINTQTVGNQVAPSVSGLSGGRFIVTWTDESGIGDGSSSSIQAQIFDASGGKIGPEFRVNTQTTSTQDFADVTRLSNGGFVVTWYDLSDTNVKAQVYDASGNAVGAELTVNTQTAGVQQSPAISALANGGFVVAWEDSSVVKAQLYDNAGSKVGGEVLATLPNMAPQETPDVAGLPGGGFVLIWTGPSSLEIGGQRFNDAGAKVGAQFYLVNQTGTQEPASVAALANGGFVITWTYYSVGAYDSIVKAQIYDPAGTKFGNEIQINEQNAFNQIQPAIAGLSDSEFVVAWTDFSSTLGDASSSSVKATIYAQSFGLTTGNDSVTAPAGLSRIDAGPGIDTITFGFKLTDATVTYAGNTIVVESGSTRAILTGFEKYVFTDGTVDNSDGSPLIDDLFYYSRYHDVWNAHVDADAHYNANGWHENRDPNAFFDTSVYLASNPGVRDSGVNPLSEYSQGGWKNGRLVSFNFDDEAYLAANPDVKAAGVNPLAHFLANGAAEGRVPIAPTEYFAPNGFDYVYYLKTYADVAAAHVDPFVHFQQAGWKEGRSPNALFDTQGYLATYTDVKNAGVNPLDHYHANGWKEGRDPSVSFDSSAYLAAYPDVKAAGVDPLLHYLDHGRHEGRSAFADGVWG